MVSSNVMALMLSDAKMASLSARVGSSLLGTLADRMTHMSHKLTLTARKSARLSGDPCNIQKKNKTINIVNDVWSAPNRLDYT